MKRTLLALLLIATSAFADEPLLHGVHVALTGEQPDLVAGFAKLDARCLWISIGQPRVWNKDLKDAVMRQLTADSASCGLEPDSPSATAFYMAAALEFNELVEIGGESRIVPSK
jgi:hypothetical protein